jgi:hypothetical protein
MAALAFRAMDDSVLKFDIPKGCNRYLVSKAIERIHKGGDEELATFGLTRRETEFIAEVVAELESHRKTPEAA